MHDKEQQPSIQRRSRSWHLPLLEEQWPGPEVFSTRDTFRGRSFWLYSINEEEPIAGLPGLAHVLPIAESGPYRSPLLVPTQQGLSHFGLLAVSPETNIPLEREGMTLDTLFSARWLFAVEWVSTLSAWDALLFTFDHLDPLVIGLKPTLVFPTLLVAHLAHHPHSSVFETLQMWAPLLDDLQERLLTLLLALYLYWFDGPSQTAQAHRARGQDSDPLPEESRVIFEAELAAFERLGRLGSMRSSMPSVSFQPCFGFWMKSVGRSGSPPCPASSSRTLCSGRTLTCKPCFPSPSGTLTPALFPS